MTNRSYVLGGMVLALLGQACSAQAGISDIGTGNGGGNGTTSGTGAFGAVGGGGVTANTATGSGGGKTDTPLAACFDTGAMIDKIEGANPGDTIFLDVCTLEGPITIPAGVTVQGKGIGQSRIEVKGGTYAINLTPGDPAARLLDVTVVSNGTAAIASKGAGAIELTNVEVTLTRGVGVALEGLKKASLSKVSVTGPVTPRTANAFSEDGLPKNSATHGIVALGVTEIKLDSVTVSGLTEYGALFLESNLKWTTGGSSQNLGTGLLVAGGTATLDGVSLCGALQGTRKVPSFNGAFLLNAGITSTDLTVCDSGGMGLLQVGSTAKHTHLTATGNAGPAVWVQKSASFEMLGDSNLIDDNQFAGLVFLEVANVHLVNTKVTNTAAATRPFGVGGGSLKLGDGIQLVRSSSGTTFENVVLGGNAHTGLQVDLGLIDILSPLVHMKWMGVTADSSGQAFGALCQGSPLNIAETWKPGEYGWDTGITRTGAALINDGLLIDPNELVGLIDPNEIPSPTSLLKGGGLASLGVKGL